LVVGVKLIGMLPAIALFVAGYMTLEGRISARQTALIVVPFTVALYLLFQTVLHVPWPTSVLGDLIPGLRALSGRLL